jgi:hypothetical protein
MLDNFKYQTPPPPAACPYGTPNTYIIYAFVDGELRGRCSLAASLTHVRSGLFDPYRRANLMREHGCQSPTYRTMGDRLRNTYTIACQYFSGQWV